MKTDKNAHNLGSVWRPNSQSWFYLIVDDSGKWRIEMEKDYDDPNKSAEVMPVEQEHFSKHKVDGIPLVKVIENKLAELGLKPN